MVDKCNTIKSENIANNQDSFAFPKIGGELFKIVKSIKANVDDFCEIKDEAKKIPSPHCSLIIHSSDKEKDKKKHKPNQLIRLGCKKKKSDKDMDKNNKNIKKSSSAEKDKPLYTTLYLFKKTLLSDNNNNNAKDVSQKSESVKNSKAKSPPPKSQTHERKTTPVRQRTPSPQRQQLPNNNKTKKNESPKKNNKFRKNETQVTQPKSKVRLFSFGKKGAKNPMKNKGQKEKVHLNGHPRSPPPIRPITAVEIKKKESNKNIPTEKASRLLSVYKSSRDCSSSDESLQSCKSVWLYDDTNTQKVVITSRNNHTKEEPQLTAKLQLQNYLHAGASTKIIITELREQTDKGVEATASQITTLEKEIQLVNLSKNKNDKTKDKLNKNKNTKNGNDKNETSMIKICKDTKETKILQKNSCPKKEEIKIVEEPNKTSHCILPNVDKVKSQSKPTKFVKEPEKSTNEGIKIANEATKSTNGSVKSANVATISTKVRPKSANDPTKSANEPTKSANDQTKSANEPTKFANKPTKSSNEPEKSAMEQTISTNEPLKSTNDSTKSANGSVKSANVATISTKAPSKSANDPIKSANDPTKSSNEPTKSANDQTKSANEPTKFANKPTESSNEPEKSAMEQTISTNEPLKSTSDSTKSANKTTKSANGSVKSENVATISTKVPSKSANDPIKSANEPTKSSNEPAKSANEPTKPANRPTSKKNCDRSNNKTSKNQTQSPSEKQKTTNPPKLVQVLKWDQRNQSGKVNGVFGLEANKSKNILLTKRTKSVYHNMCTVSKPPLNEPPQIPMPGELRKIKAEVDQAIAQKKIFTICGNYYSIRKALIKRGWIEKMKISFRSSGLVRKLNTTSMVELLDLLKDKEQGCLARRIIISRMLANHPVDLFWDYSNSIFKNSTLYNNKHPLINRLWSGVFGYSSKSGLCDTVKRAHWYQIPGVSCLNHPRTYNFAHAGDPHDFLDDYKRTAAMSVLKCIVERSTDKVIKLISNNGKIPLSMFEFALVECKRYLKICKHKDIDMKFAEASDFEWHQFFEHFYALIHLEEHFKSNDVETVESLVLKSKIILGKVKKYFPYLEMDNTMNIWILKPCNGCRGIGIHLCRALEYILTIVKNNPQRKYVIQKYIERPLLIHHTKFDIRQWFLISNTNPLTLWIYKECYVRLSSQTFDIRKLHESIHLTNNSIQARYRNSNRDSSLPRCNMWTLNQFKKYLDLIGHPKVFDEVIFPGMKQNIICAVLANQHRIYRKKNTFEIYGSDFMITEDFKPWLLEINCRPALYGSTPVTAKLCPKVLEDTIKMMVDHERDKKPNTSNFELLYKEKLEKLPKVDPESFVFHIRSLTEDFFVKPEHLHLTITQEETEDDSNDADLTILSLKSEMKMTLERLLGLIKTEKEKRIGLNSHSLMNTKISKEVQSETNTLEGALKDVTLIMNLDHVKLPYCTNCNKCQLNEGMHLMQNKTFDEESEDDDDDDYDELSDLAEENSFVPTKDLAKSLISGFLHQLEKLE